MKNVFLMLAFMVVGGLAFASSGDVELISKDEVRITNNLNIVEASSSDVDWEDGVKCYKRYTSSDGDTILVEVKCPDVIVVEAVAISE